MRKLESRRLHTPGATPPSVGEAVPRPARQAGVVQQPGADGHRMVMVSAGIALIALVTGIATLSGDRYPTDGTSLGLGTFLLAGVSLIATLSYLAMFAALHALPTGLSPVRNAVSDYAVGAYGPLFRAGLYASSVGVLALAFALIQGLGSPPFAARDLVYLLLIPLTRVGMAAFPTSLEGVRLSRTGVVHYLFAIAAFTLTYLAISETTAVLGDVASGLWLQSPLRWIEWLVAPELFLVVATMFRPLRRVFGLCERAFLLTTNLWFVLVALLLLDRAG